MKTHIKNRKKEGWDYEAKDGRKVLTNPKTKDIEYPDYLHNEIEHFTPNGKHTVIDPVTGREIPWKSGKHKLPNWLK